MKSVLLGLASLVATSALAFAAEPVKTADTSAGKIYTDENGRTLYVFDKDQKGKSTCYATCARRWPPFKAAADAKADGDWTVIERTDGTKMWAYEGKPLYTFADDKKQGDVEGNGVGGAWHVIKVP